MSDLGKGANAPSKDIVYRQDVEDMLQNALPSRGMWEIEGDVAKNAICETVVDLMMDLKKLPSAQPEQRKGHWIETVEDWRNQIVWWGCSECGMDVSTRYNYCPDCGADMRGDDK